MGLFYCHFSVHCRPCSQTTADVIETAVIVTIVNAATPGLGVTEPVVLPKESDDKVAEVALIVQDGAEVEVTYRY